MNYCDCVPNILGFYEVIYFWKGQDHLEKIISVGILKADVSEKTIKDAKEKVKKLVVEWKKENIGHGKEYQSNRSA